MAPYHLLIMKKKLKERLLQSPFQHNADGQQCCSKLRQMYENTKAVKHQQNNKGGEHNKWRLDV